MTKTNNKAHRSDYDLHADYQNIKTALADATQDVKGRAGEILHHSLKSVKGKSADLKDNVETYITKKPFQSIGIAVATGFILGFLLRK